MRDKNRVEFFEEEENKETNALGLVKHWHKYFVVANKLV